MPKKLDQDTALRRMLYGIAYTIHPSERRAWIEQACEEIAARWPRGLPRYYQRASCPPELAHWIRARLKARQKALEEGIAP